MNDQQFTEWNGGEYGECPTGFGAIVEAVLRDGDTVKSAAWMFDWSHDNEDGDIMKYRVVEE